MGYPQVYLIDLNNYVILELMNIKGRKLIISI